MSLRDFIKSAPSNPSLFWALAIFAVASGVLGIYFGLTGIKAPDLTYRVNPYPSVIANRNGIDSLKIFFGDRPINSAVSTSTVTIWNAGSAPIRDTDILEPPIIQMPAGARILERKVLKESRPVINSLLSEKTTKSLDEGNFNISWKILEPKDAILLQITYEGEPTTNISFSAVIVGQKDASKFETSTTNLNPKKDNPSGDPPWLLAVMALGFLSFGLSGISTPNKTIQVWIYHSIALLMAALCLGALFYDLFIKKALPSI